MTSEEKWVLRPIGIYWLGYKLERLEWASAAVTDLVQLAGFLAPFRGYAQVYSLEDIGREATWWHDKLLNQLSRTVDEGTRNALRTLMMRWGGTFTNHRDSASPAPAIAPIFKNYRLVNTSTR